MKDKLIVAITGCVLLIPAVQAGEFKVANANITMSGGATAGYFYSDNTGSGDQEDRHVSDFLIDLSSAPTPTGVGFVAGVGLLKTPTVINGGIIGAQIPAESVDLQYGSVTVKPNEAFSVEAGRLATKIGYEVAPTYLNANILLGGLWNSQPLYYPGLRASYNFGTVTGFVEANDDTSGGANDAIAAGLSGAAGDISYSVAYQDADGGRNILDVIVSGKLGGIPVAANLDYHMLDDRVKVAGNDDSAFGLALYAKPKLGAVLLPVRVEYLSDGTSGIYGGVDSAYTLAVTPTYNFSETTYIRAEVAHVSSDKKVFFDNKGVAQDTNTSFAVQAGILF